MFEDDCVKILKVLAEVESERSVLEFKLYQVEQSLKIERMRLMAEISLCDHVSVSEANRLRSEAIRYFNEYVMRK
ncbi:hypothetical protein [Metallosphaera hakonensis]|uniref:Uncharacterized protein n=1 Tax=Metallosphaera hakonensis JCM 8857 = DSM 7519 TaxID=1293036 RepID=A0A2U9IW24_9CREN|nr:hypothetical protein [Metallosphaera hakonensis]AWS00239.1 hypothetical protein DFR87_11730 [Metallosphaera hakonensis JCM 8857 = DSM 7519]